ncbi:MAG: dihydropteroate synthase [Chloroflexi bacterium]|nr:dihydropteroate synthase [Chloroflexota bacterium]
MPTASLRCGRFTLPLGGKTYLLGIINITDDSFSGGGFLGDPEGALRQALRFVAEGADLIDVGGEPGGPETPVVPAAEEIDRVAPLIERLARETAVPISVDTYKPEVAEAALQAGASMVNDIAGFSLGDGAARAAARHGAAYVVNFIYGRPKVQPPKPPADRDLIQEHLDFLRAGIERARAAGLADDAVVIDPGIAFGKSHDEDLEVLRRLGEFRALGRPLLVAASRKGFIGSALSVDGREPPPDERLEGTAAVVALNVAHGVDFVRVHDVRAMAQVARMADAIVRGQAASPSP